MRDQRRTFGGDIVETSDAAESFGSIEPDRCRVEIAESSREVDDGFVKSVPEEISKGRLVLRQSVEHSLPFGSEAHAKFGHCGVGAEEVVPSSVVVAKGEIEVAEPDALDGEGANGEDLIASTLLSLSGRRRKSGNRDGKGLRRGQLTLRSCSSAREARSRFGTSSSSPCDR